MGGRIRELNRALKRYDMGLYCQMDDSGFIHVYSRYNETTNYVLSLTDDWTIKGKPVSWGIEPILNRIRAHDLSKNVSFMKDLEKSWEKLEASRKKDFSNSVESFMLDFRSQFKKAFKDINPSMIADKQSRIEDSRRIENGNR